jgi:hypothetical protein
MASRAASAVSCPDLPPAADRSGRRPTVTGGPGSRGSPTRAWVHTSGRRPAGCRAAGRCASPRSDGITTTRPRRGSAAPSRDDRTAGRTASSGCAAGAAASSSAWRTAPGWGPAGAASATTALSSATRTTRERGTSSTRRSAGSALTSREPAGRWPRSAAAARTRRRCQRSRSCASPASGQGGLARRVSNAAGLVAATSRRRCAAFPAGLPSAAAPRRGACAGGSVLAARDGAPSCAVCARWAFRGCRGSARQLGRATCCCGNGHGARAFHVPACADGADAGRGGRRCFRRHRSAGLDDSRRPPASHPLAADTLGDAAPAAGCRFQRAGSSSVGTPGPSHSRWHSGDDAGRQPCRGS